jgi:hypothetical protein
LRAWLVGVACFVSSTCLVLDVRAEVARRPIYTIAIGQNSVADALKKEAAGVATLRYADDDALRFHELMRTVSRRTFLLSVLDADTQQRFPRAASGALAPTLAELERAVDTVVSAMRRDRERGEEPELVFFYSGHGVHGESGTALSLLDGGLTRQWLYERLLARVPARLVHLVIDACHAAAVVRPRDANASLEALGESERQAYVDDMTLARFPQVGAVLASSAGTQSFEWDAYRAGVFAHQFLSGLRGGADVNDDGRVEYSEMAAFLSAANLRVSDPRARLEIVVRPPPMDRRAPLVELAATGELTLEGPADGAWARGFFVEDERGERLLDVFPEQGANLRLRLPRAERLYVVRSDGEAELRGRDVASATLASLSVRPARTRARGAIDSALRQGLFAARFGPAFYLGFVSRERELVPVSFALEHAESRGDRSEPSHASRGALPIALLASAGAAAVATGVFVGLALDAKGDYEGTDLERQAHDARGRFERMRAVAWIGGSVAVALGGAGLVVLAWPTNTARAARLGPDGLLLGVRGQF